MTDVQNMPSASGTESDRIADGVIRDWLDDRRVVVFTISTIAVESIDAWFTTSKKMLEGWPKDQPYLALYDVSAPNIVVTPTFRARVFALANVAPDVRGRVAVVMPGGPLSWIIRSIVNRLTSDKAHARAFRAFSSRVAALDWLRKKPEDDAL